MLRIRLSRVGKRKQPSYRLVVADSHAPRDGAFIKIIGHYNPRTEPTTLVVKEDEAIEWLKRGAKPSDTAAKLLTGLGVMERAGLAPVVWYGKTPVKSKKELAAEAEAAGAPAPAPAAPSAVAAAPAAAAAAPAAVAAPPEEPAPEPTPEPEAAAEPAAEAAAEPESAPELEAEAAAEPEPEPEAEPEAEAGAATPEDSQPTE